MHNAFMKSEESKRLEEARRRAGFDTASAAAEALGVNKQTYLGHENGLRGFRKDSAQLYARKFGVNVDWLFLKQGPRERGSYEKPESVKTVPLVGYVAAGSEMHYINDSGEMDRLPAPDGSTEETVAVEIRGESLGPLFDRCLAFYDNVQRPVSNDHINKLCVVGLSDGRIMIKKVQRSRGKGTFHLISNGFEPPILDVEIDWAARVKNIVPR
jgi:DNA-binding XRE family transcriptional regulator